MKKNLLSAIVVFFLTFIVLLVMSDVFIKENNQLNEKFYVTSDSDGG